MWRTDTLWVEVAAVSALYALGNILLGHFEERTPKWRRVGKYLATVALTLGLSAGPGRPWAFGLLGLGLCVVAFVHGRVLPRRGIHGWTGEPRRRYYAMRGWQWPEG
jgi:hypothetical protein